LVLITSSKLSTSNVKSFRWLKEVMGAGGMWAYQEALDVDKDESVTMTAYATFTNLLGLKAALAELLPRAVSKQVMAAPA
jgi:hypothetical protein